MKTKAKKAKADRKSNGGGFQALQQPDEILGAVVGSKPKPRTQITKKLWEYIKDNDLQSKKDGRVILAKKDKKLRKLLGADEVNMMKMTGIVSKHMSPAED